VSKVKHLWQHEHPYYMCEGNYYTGDSMFKFDSWEDFIDEWGDADIDYNRIHRWDFSDLDDSDSVDKINFYYVTQRKAGVLSCHVSVDRKRDEEKIRKFLKPHAKLNKKLWEGVL